MVVLIIVDSWVYWVLLFPCDFSWHWVPTTYLSKVAMHLRWYALFFLSRLKMPAPCFTMMELLLVLMLEPRAQPIHHFTANKWFCCWDLKLSKGIWNMVSKIFKKDFQEWLHEQVEQFISQQAQLCHRSEQWLEEEIVDTEPTRNQL